jgi:thioredoxin 1
MAIENKGDFRLRVIDQPGIVIVDFWASWCEPCKMIRSEIKRVAETFETKVKVVKVDVDAFHELAEQYEVMAVPTLLFFKDGRLIKRLIGYASQQEIEKLLHTLE